MMTSPDTSGVTERQAVYFVHLHLDTVEMHAKHLHRSGHCIYVVEGKPRPMLVLRRLPGRERGRTWCLVLPITSKGLDEEGKPRKGILPIGNCLDPSRDSFLELNVLRLPDNMVCRKEGKSPNVQPCDPFGFMNAIKHVERLRLSNELTISATHPDSLHQ